MNQLTTARLRENLRDLAANLRVMHQRADREASRCNATMASIHPESLTPMAFVELKNATRELSDVYVTSLGRLAASIDDLAASITDEVDV